MFIRDALGDCKPRITPGTGLGSEVVAVDDPQGLRGPRPGNYKIPVEQHGPILERLLRGEHPKAIAAQYGVTRQAIHNISLKHGLARPFQKAKRREMEQGVIDRYLATYHGRIVAAYANQVEPVAWTVLARDQQPLVIRKRDDIRIRVYLRNTSVSPSPGQPNMYYNVHIGPGGVTIVALPDGEAFVVEPVTKPVTLVFRTDPAKRQLSRSRYRSFQLEVQP